MTASRRHHYVPRFYLNGFTDTQDNLWVLDKTNQRVFCGGVTNIGLQRDYYRIEHPHDHPEPNALELSFSHLEDLAAPIFRAWTERAKKSDEKFLKSDEERGVISDYFALQILRVPEQRIQLHQYQIELAKLDETFAEAAAFPLGALHLQLLTDEFTFEALSQAIFNSTWILARNFTNSPFTTSDNPVLVRSEDNSEWLKPNAFLNDPESYLVFPLTSREILFCYQGENSTPLRKFDGCFSPVTITEVMVDIENSGQICCSYRFVYSCSADFSALIEFASKQPIVFKPDRNRWRDLPENPYKGQ